MIRETFIPGHARPKGSLDASAARDGAGQLTGRVYVKDSPQSIRWRRTVEKHVAALSWPTIESGPVSVSMTFWFMPPVGEHGRYAIGGEIGDLDKLVRNVLDALEDAGVYANDRQVAILSGPPIKLYVIGLERPGLALRVWEL